MKSKLITFLCMGLYLVGCGNNDPMNSLYNSELTEAENQLLKCSKKNRAALKEKFGKRFNPSDPEIMAWHNECSALNKENRKGICSYDTEENRNARDALEKTYSEKNPELFQAFLDSCKSNGIDAKQTYLMRTNPKYKDRY